jgi:endonuclease III
VNRKEKFEKVLSYFEQQNPSPETELTYSSPYELIVAVILSAQCTDIRVNMITPEFFRTFPNERILSQAQQKDVFEKIKSCSYPNNKAKNLIGMAKTLVNRFHGIVPSDIEDLQQLSGVGRKTANVIASVVHQKPTMAVDTHIFRVANRIGLTLRAKNPLETELQLIKYIPENKIRFAHHWLLLHGRYVCKARTPLCLNCGLTDCCKYYRYLNSKASK